MYCSMCGELLMKLWSNARVPETRLDRSSVGLMCFHYDKSRLPVYDVVECVGTVFLEWSVTNAYLSTSEIWVRFVLSIRELKQRLMARHRAWYHGRISQNAGAYFTVVGGLCFCHDNQAIFHFQLWSSTNRLHPSLVEQFKQALYPLLV